MAVSLSPVAVKRVKELMDRQNLQHAFLRMGVKAGGCSGLSYNLEFDTELGKFDKQFEIDGVKVELARSGAAPKKAAPAPVAAPTLIPTPARTARAPEDGLVEALRRLATDKAFRDAEAERLHQFVLDWHDEARVALRLLNLYDDAFAWRRRLRVGMLKQVAPEPVKPKARKPRTTRKPDPQVVEPEVPEAA